jgi:hypothetical protein
MMLSSSSWVPHKQPTSQLQVQKVDERQAAGSMVVSLHHLQLLLYGLELIIGIHRLHSMRESWWLNALEISKPIPQQWWWHLGLGVLHIDHGLLHGMKHLCLHS